MAKALKLVRGFMAPPTFTVARQADLYYKSPTDASLGPHPSCSRLELPSRRRGSVNGRGTG